MNYHVGVLVPSELGGWRALFPDLPGCIAEGPNLEITVNRAADALAQHAGVRSSKALSSPMARNATANRLDESWAAAHGFSLRTAIISMIPLRGNDHRMRGSDAASWNPGTFVTHPPELRPAEQPTLEASLSGIASS